MSAPQVQGEHLVQSPVISSSSDLYNTPFVSKFAIRGRAYYRTPMRRVTFPWNPSLQFQSLQTVSCVGFSMFSCTQYCILWLFRIQLKSSLIFVTGNKPAAKSEEVSTRYATLSVLLIFVTSLTALYTVYQTFPQVTEWVNH